METRMLLHVSDCFDNKWVRGHGMYWAVSSVSDGKATLCMSKSGGNCPSAALEKRTHRRANTDKYPTTRSYNNGKLTAGLVWAGGSRADFLIKDVIPGAGIDDLDDFEFGGGSTGGTGDAGGGSWAGPFKPQIISNHSDKLGYTVGDIIKSECIVKNIGGDGTVYLTVGVGYIGSGDMIYLTGFPVTDQLFLKYNQSYTFKEDVKVDITDYYRQRGIGWAYLQRQMYLFFMVGHKENNKTVWDTERHIKIYLDEPKGFIDPTSLDESVAGDVIEGVTDAGEYFGGGGILAPIFEKGGEMLADKAEEALAEKTEEVASSLMPLVYIGFAGVVGYLVLRSQQ